MKNLKFSRGARWTKLKMRALTPEDNFEFFILTFALGLAQHKQGNGHCALR